jgi:hypothetical protein
MMINVDCLENVIDSTSQLIDAYCNLTMDSLNAYKFQCFRNTGHTNIWSTIVKLFLRNPALPVKVTLNRNYLR